MKEHGLAPGIYFNLPADVYHADPALSRSNIVALNDTPFTYWEQSWMNPDRRPEPASDAMAYGEAFHTQLFEPERFEREYFVFPTDKWDTGRRMISKEDHDAIVASIRVLRAGKDSGLLLSGGKPEVTIIFDWEGLRFRARHDYLTPVLTVDFKTTFSLEPWHLKRAFDKYGYDVQMFLYKLSRARFKEQFHLGEAHVYGQVEEEFFKKFMQSEMNDFILIMQRKTPPYPFEVLCPEEDTQHTGEDRTRRAIEVFRKSSDKSGTKPWEISDGRLKRFSMNYGMINEE